MIENYERWFSPAICREVANGRERNPCEICKKTFKKGDEMVEVVSGSFRNRFNYERLCPKCFIELLALNFPEVFEIEDEIKKQIVIERLK